MFRLMILLLAMTLLPLPAMAEAPLSFAEESAGMYIWPANASETEASYVYRYAYPCIAGDSSLATAINFVFQGEIDYALDFECPMDATSHRAEDGQMLVTIDYEITHVSSSNLSVRINKTVSVGELTTSTIKAFTFVLDNERAGTVTSLPYFIGLIDDGETNEWYIERQTSKADACVQEMVWAMIERDMKREDSVIYDFITLEELAYGFYPEADFYLDAEGNLVFFIQAGEIAPRDAGHFFYTISLDELLDEI